MVPFSFLSLRGTGSESIDRLKSQLTSPSTFQQALRNHKCVISIDFKSNKLKQLPRSFWDDFYQSIPKIYCFSLLGQLKIQNICTSYGISSLSIFAPKLSCSPCPCYEWKTLKESRSHEILPKPAYHCSVWHFLK